MPESKHCRPSVLVTNDDGINSGFLKILVQQLARHFDVVVAAPAEEKSWIGRAMTRHGEVSVDFVEGWPSEAWAVGGTPTDCINIALGHLLARQPDLVISGINIGYNTTVPLVYSSGTVAGALEGASWGLPAIAVSQALDRDHFLAASAANGELPEALSVMLRQTADQTAGFAQRLLEDASQRPNTDLTVHNINFPFPSSAELEWARTVPARAQTRCYFQKSEDSEGFRFAYHRAACGESGPLTDRQAVESGRISWSILNFSEIGRV
ncbi:MAG: 5'/3'-nucleotidase SurE [Opitutales bacterium]|nr:5'/3'-nucleotidase SurE [Opitutales bacterium]